MSYVLPVAYHSARHNFMLGFSARGSNFDTPPWLALYEYCLGLDMRTSYVNSRRNPFYRMFRVIQLLLVVSADPQLVVTANWHIQFDVRDCFSNLPDTKALEYVRDFVQSIVNAKKDA